MNNPPSWQDIARFVFEKKSGYEPIVLYTSDLASDPCSYLGKNILQIANDQRTSNNAIAFAIGEGPCLECTIPTLIWWNPHANDWQNMQTSSLDTYLNRVTPYILSNNLNVAYLMYADPNLNISRVIRSYQQKDVNGILQLHPGCIQSSSSGSSNFQQTSSAWSILLWILIILLILFVLWILYRFYRQHRAT